VDEDGSVVARFAELYYGAGDATWKGTWWLGVQTFKCPLDLWVYQELVHDVRPDLIVETGTANGGSALFMASICELLGRGEVVTIDISRDGALPQHARLRYITGSSTAPATVDQVRVLARGRRAVMVVLDSDHHRDHVLAEMRSYGPLVTRGSYLVVEDTCVNGNPVEEGFGPGPMEAVDEFLREDPRFVIDRGREKFMMTFNPRGYLRRVG
jgi:cephalosporin hydroxylase